MDRLLNLFRRLTQTAAPKGTRRQRRGRPALEGLEDRITPSNIIFEYDQPFLKSSPGADGIAATAVVTYDIALAR